jgi:nitroimidazol reductase NimA-like FMN-containing flavoprotein (pyridoxamine 5'-phosphate oxidase superfamily)
MADGVTPNQKARAIIDDISYITVATTDKNGEPWNTPVAGYHFDNDYTLYWASWAENQHSKNIRANGKAFIVIYDSTPSDGPTEGVYIQALATELTDEDEVMRAALVFGDDPYNPSDGGQYLGHYPRRIYKAVPQKVWLNDDSKINDHFIDMRTVAEE